MPNFSHKELENCFSHPKIKNTFDNIYHCLGLITAVASSPEPIIPSEWMEQLKKHPNQPPEFESEQQVKAFSGNLISWWNNCITLFDHGQQIQLPEKITLTATGKTSRALRDFCTGYLKGYTWLSKTWQAHLPDKDTDAARSLSVLNIILARFIDESALAKAEPELFKQLPDLSGCFKTLPNLISAVGMLGKDLSGDHDQEQEQEQEQEQNMTKTSVKNANRSVGRNDLCPCGSGKKFKKCCLH